MEINYNEVIKLVFEARKIALNKNLKENSEQKEGFDYVTQVDYGISDFIKQGLKLIAPNSAFVTEEEQTHSQSTNRFILDPIDGTTNLIRNFNLSSISLAHYCDGEIKFGVVFNPFTQEMWFALKNCGAHYFSTKFGIEKLLKKGIENYCENQIFVSNNNFNTAIFEFGANVSAKEYAKETFDKACEIFAECGDLRRMCSTALALCYIAQGSLDGYFERKIKAWDYSAGSLILTEAGGELSQWSGKSLSFNEPSTIIAGNKKVYEYLLNKFKNLK